MQENIFTRLRTGGNVIFTEDDHLQVLHEGMETRKLLVRYNQTTDTNEAQALLETLFEKVGKRVTVYPPFSTNYGKNITIGDNTYINSGCTMLGLGRITIDENVMIAPSVVITSEGHPVEPSKRWSLATNAVHIKKRAWIGANATILAGVTIGENSVVAAGAVVTKSVPDNCLVAGVPAKIIRNIAEQ